jgi:CubicO group peptidase (beta-lactamase class C family)
VKNRTLNVKRYLLAVIVLAIVLSACGGVTSIFPTATPTISVSPTVVISPTATISPAVTATGTPAARSDCVNRYPSNPSEKKNWPKDEWTVSTLEEHCMDRARVEKGAWYLEQTYNYSSLVVIRHGELVYEKYFSNSYRPDKSVTIYSMTKSFFSALIGIAMDQGLLDSLEHKISEYFPEYFYPTTDPRMQEVTLRDLLTMSVPFEWLNEDDHTIAPWINSGNMVEKAINLKFQTLPPQKPEFNYCTPNTQILSAILTKIVGEPLRRYAQRNLFSPLGIPEGKWSWGVDDHGYNLGGYGMSLRPRDIARFGYLYSNQGYWDGKQVVSTDWVGQSTSKQIQASPTLDYGYLWWLHPFKDPVIFEARGSGGHMLAVIPSLDLVVVVTGVGGGDLPDPDFVIHEYIIKAVTDLQSFP